MPNVINSLYRNGFAAINKVSKNLTGMVLASRKVMSMTPVAAGQNQPIRIPIVNPGTVQDITPSNVSSTGTDRSIDYVDINMDKERKVSWHLTSEEQMALENPNGQNEDILQQTVSQAMNSLVTEIEIDLCNLYKDASRAYGTAGTTPFGTANSLGHFSGTSRILNGNGTPVMNRHLILNLDAWDKLTATQPTLWRVNEAGDSGMREYGIPPKMFGFQVGLSSQFSSHSKGDATQAINKAGGHDIGDTVLTIDGGANTENYVHGDVITIAGDDNKYIVAVGSGTSSTTVTIQEPGLREAAANNSVISIDDNYLPNLAFHQDAIVLACRPPASNTIQDGASESVLVIDDHSNLIFEMAIYRQYRQTSIEIGICWGVGAVAPRHIATLLG